MLIDELLNTKFDDPHQQMRWDSALYGFGAITMLPHERRMMLGEEADLYDEERIALERHIIKGKWADVTDDEVIRAIRTVPLHLANSYTDFYVDKTDGTASNINAGD